ncbi:MAG: hypothetical protein QOK03_2943, partial [Candidatus Binataceae bacterium]|nr:hypothetical protein [Candidatus Binataceae bacterium]
MLDQECVADVLENGSPSTGRASLLRELTRERLDHFDHRGHLALIARQHYALGQRVRDHDHVHWRDCFHQNGTAGQNLLVLVERDFDGSGL